MFKIIPFIFDDGSGQARAGIFSDTDGDGSTDRSAPDTLLPLERINPLWEAGKKLALKDAGSRLIKTFVE